MKKRLAVIVGGRSSEHEVSLVSGASVIEGIDTDKYDVKIIVISKLNKNKFYQFNIISIMRS